MEEPIGYTFKLDMYVSLSDRPKTQEELYRRVAQAAVSQLLEFDVDMVADIISDLKEEEEI